MFAKKKQKALAIMLAFALVIGQFCSVPFAREAKASAGYTVTLTNAENVFLCNKIPTDGPVTIEYTVATKTNVGYNREGAVVTTDPEAERPFIEGVGSMQYEEIVYLLDTDAGCTNKAVISKSGDGKAHGDFYVPGKWNETWSLPKSTETAATTAQYFGLWFENTSDSAAGAEKLVLTNVTCTDAEGNDLGLQSNSAACVIAGGEPETPEEPEEPGAYKVTMSDTGNVFLCNRIPTNGPVTITYKVESAADTFAWHGVAVTADKTGVDDKKGQARYTGKYLLNVGYEHRIEIAQDASTGEVSNAASSYTVYGLGSDPSWESDGPWTFGGNVYGTANKKAQYYGLWFANGGATSIVLTDVTCKDADGNDLGLQCYSEGVSLEKEVEAAEYDTAVTEEGYVVPAYENVAVDGEAVEAGTRLTTTGVYRVVYTFKGVTCYRTVTVTKLGDANMDAVLNLKDVMHVLKNIGQEDIDELKMKCADVNNSGALEREDANIIKALLAETVTAQEVKDTYR